MRYYDTIIVGQGLAGTALAWQMEFAGRNSFLVIDREPPITSSRIAAGLVTPITGQRLVKAEHFEEHFREAEAFYRRVEALLHDPPHPTFSLCSTVDLPLRGGGEECGAPPTRRSRSARPSTSPIEGEVKSAADNEAFLNTDHTHLPPGGGGRPNEVRSGGGEFFHSSPMLRLFQNERERQIFETKKPTEFAGLVEEHPKIDSNDLDAPLGGFTMTLGGRLDASGYLNRSREWLHENGRYLRANLNEDADVDVDSNGVGIPKLDLHANLIIFCQGFLNTPNHFFRKVPFQAAQGDILTMCIPSFRKERVIHACGIWLAPLPTQGDAVPPLYRCGSTYSWEPFDGQPSAAGRAELERKLQTFLKVPFEVVEHLAAVRPIIRESRPRIGMHPLYSQLGFFNGLGSKGTLLAPIFARKFVEHLYEGAPLEPETDVREFL